MLKFGTYYTTRFIIFIRWAGHILVAYLKKSINLIAYTLKRYKQSGLLINHITNILLGITSSLIVWTGCEIQRRWRDDATEQLDLSMAEAIAEMNAPKETASLLRHRLEEYIESPSKFRPKSQEEEELITRFENHLAQHQVAFNKLTERKQREQLASIELSVGELIQLTRELRSEPHILDSCLKKLPIEAGEDAIESTIDELISNGKISPIKGAQIKALSSHLFGYSDKVLIEAEKISNSRVSTISQTLDAVGRAVVDADSQGLREIYTDYQKTKDLEQVQMLKLLIESALVCLAFDEAYFFYEELIRLNPSPKLYMEYARLLQIQNENIRAIHFYQKALELCEDSSERHTPMETMDIQAGIHNNMAILFQKNNELSKAKRHFEKALRGYKILALGDCHTYTSDLAMTFNNLGNLKLRTNDTEGAFTYYKQAHTLYQQLGTSSRGKYAAELASTLNNLAIATKRLGMPLKAKIYYYEALAIKRELARVNPQDHLPSIAVTLNNLGLIYAQSKNFVEAEAHYSEALRIRRELAELNPSAYLPLVAESFSNIASLMRKTGKTMLAQEYYKEAVTIYRKLSQKQPIPYQGILAKTLTSLALTYAEEKLNKLALHTYNEALQLRKELALLKTEEYEIDYAHTLLIGEKISGKSLDRAINALELLKKYPHNSKAQRLLQTVKSTQND